MWARSAAHFGDTIPNATMTCKTLRATMPAKCCASRHCAVRRIAATGDAVPLFDTCASCATGESVLAQLVQAGWTPPTATRTAGR